MAERHGLLKRFNAHYPRFVRFSVQARRRGKLGRRVRLPRPAWAEPERPEPRPAAAERQAQAPPRERREARAASGARQVLLARRGRFPER